MIRTGVVRAGVDWGSSSFRAYRFDDAVNLIDQVATPTGIREVDLSRPDAYERVLFDSIGHWLVPGDVVLLSGMITSRTGWHETPYLECPANVSEIAAHAVSKAVRGMDLRFLPGINQLSPNPDVMRGEELQLLGASLGGSLGGSLGVQSSIVILPGTHSKWAHVKDGCLQQFHTVMTGELFEIILKHSLVGAMSSSDAFDQSSFLQGVKSGFTTDTLLSDIFTLRASVLLEQAQGSALHSRLSGMLIGREIREGVQLMAGVDQTAMMLVGSDALCALYERAFQHLEFSITKSADTAAIAGFQKIAAGLNTN